MKKKTLLIIGGAIALIAVIVLAIFAFSGEKEEAAMNINLEGTWKVAVYNNGNMTIVDNEFMVFDEKTAKDYRGNNAEPFVSSNYTIDSNKLTLPDISKSYTIDRRTENYIRLYESQDTFLELIRYKNSDMSAIEVDPNLMSGKWDIVYRNTDKPYSGSYLFFENGMIEQYQAGSNDPVASANYEIDDSHLVVDGWGKDMVIYQVNESTVVLVELASDKGFIWELQKGTNN